ncbi:MAG: hypothetical protein ACRD4B_07445, partial [Acidobacteriota bacterium]
MQKQKKKWSIAIIALLIALPAIGFIALRVPHHVSQLDIVNEANVQNAVNLKNLTIPLNAYILAEFDDAMYAVFFRKSRFSTHQYEQVGSPWQDGLSPPPEVCDEDPTIPGCPSGGGGGGGGG